VIVSSTAMVLERELLLLLLLLVLDPNYSLLGVRVMAVLVPKQKQEPQEEDATVPQRRLWSSVVGAVTVAVAATATVAETKRRPMLLLLFPPSSWPIVVAVGAKDSNAERATAGLELELELEEATTTTQ